MLIQVNDERRIVSILDKGIVDDDGKEIGMITDDYFEFEFPEDFDISNFNEYIIKDGKLVYSKSDTTRFYEIENLKAELSETDYISAKMNDAIMTCTTVEEILQVNREFNEKYGAVLTRRQALRDEINNLQNKED